MFEKSSAREALASLVLVAGSLGGVSSIETVQVFPVRDTNVPPLLLGYLRDDEKLRIDSNGEPHRPPPLNNRSLKSEPTHPIRRVYGYTGQQSFRNRTDIRSTWWHR